MTVVTVLIGVAKEEMAGLETVVKAGLETVVIG